MKIIRAQNSKILDILLTTWVDGNYYYLRRICIITTDI